MDKYTFKSKSAFDKVSNSSKLDMGMELNNYLQKLEQDEKDRADPVKLAEIQRRENIEVFDFAMKSLLNKADYYGKIAFSGTLEQLIEIKEDALKYESMLGRSNAKGSDPILNLEILKLKNECLLRIRADNDLIQKRIDALTIKVKTNAVKPTTTLPFIAAIQFYRDEEINTKNFKEIAKKWKIDASSKLYQEYNIWREKINRMGDEESNTKNKNKLNLYEKIIKHLENEPITQQKAIDDMNTFAIRIKHLTG